MTDDSPSPPADERPRLPQSDLIKSRLAEAETAASEADLEWRKALVAAVTTGDQARVEQAEAHLMKTRREIARLEAILAEVAAQDAETARAEQKARDAAQDAQLIKAYEALCKTAHVLGRKLASYTGAYAAFIEAGKAVRELGQVNRRMRQDLLWQDFDKLVSLELARVSPAQALPPGADAWAASARNVSELTPLAQEIENLMQAVRKGLNRA